jgi:transposase
LRHLFKLRRVFRAVAPETHSSKAALVLFRRGGSPDHSAFSRARNERFREGDVFRQMFERIVEGSIAAGLVGGEGFAVDASLIQADANKQRAIAGQDWRKDRDPARSTAR